MQELIPKDGPTTSPESATSQPPAVIEPPSEEEQAIAEARRLGASRSAAYKLFAAMRPAKFLNRRVTGGVALIAQANSLEQLARTQKGMRVLMRDKNVDARVRVAAGAVMAQCAMAIARHSESMMDVAKDVDGEGQQADTPKPPSVAVNIQNNTFTPPVAAPRSTPITVAAKSGESE